MTDQHLTAIAVLLGWKNITIAFLLKHVRRITPIADWLDDRKATHDARKLREKYAPPVAKAEREKDSDARDGLRHEWGYESDLTLHPVYERHAERLTAKARRYGITVPRQPNDPGDESADWYASNVYGFWLPTPELEERLRREIRDER